MSTDAPYAIEASNIHKRYGNLQALRGVSFSVPQGCVYSILGPNGAGKTTLLKILTTITRADEGEVQLLGQNLASSPIEIRNVLGVVAQENHFEKYFSVWDNLCLHARMHGMPRCEYEPRIGELMTQVGLYERRHEKAENFSGGMQRKVSLIRALIHRPKILFLDEPTTGLDPMARRQMWESIEALKSQATVILTTHYMEEADVLSDQILMLNHGRVVKTGTPRELKLSLMPANTYELALRVPRASDYKSRIESMFCDRDCCPDSNYVTIQDDYSLQMTLGECADLPAILSLISPDELLRLGYLESDLEQVFLSIARQHQDDTQEAETPEVQR